MNFNIKTTHTIFLHFSAFSNGENENEINSLGIISNTLNEFNFATIQPFIARLKNGIVAGLIRRYVDKIQFYDDFDAYQQFQKYVKKYARNYTKIDFAYRFYIISKNLNSNNEHSSNPYSTYKRGTHRFMDMTLTDMDID